MPVPERRPLRPRLIGLALSGVLVVPSVAACGSSGDDDEQTAYCVDANNQVVDDSNCDERNGYGGGFFFLFLATGGFGRGSYIPTTGGTRINPADSAARVRAGLPGTGKAAGTTIRSGGIGKGSGGATGSGG
ncbi:hypothetical protein [Nakamurella deserti]|uniref:hypothetical protein n=1 Tax=Nakamurella deserti TaxID=2164074 RepID=UPI000DBE8491|nr:hypothetical protein [Nakamurella deserti]